MKRILLSIVAIFFPWIIIFLDDNPLGGFFAIFLQATIIGWIPATIWAWNIVHRPPEPATPTSKEEPSTTEPKTSRTKIPK